MAFKLRVFKDRSTAGVTLARRLKKQSIRPPLLVLGLPRGGVPVAYEVARVLDAPLDVMLVRKIGMPRQPELAIGAVASGNITVHSPQIGPEGSEMSEVFERLAQNQRREIERRELVYRSGLPPLDLRGRSVILVDDGIATGSTMLAAIRATRKAGALAIIVAAPVASPEAEEVVRSEADDAVILQTPPTLLSIGEWYQDFNQIEDSEVCRLLELSRQASADASRISSTTAQTHPRVHENR